VTDPLLPAGGEGPVGPTPGQQPDQSSPGSARAARVAPALARVAVTVAVVTVLARVMGFGRTWVLSQSLGTSCLGTAFTTANTIPNVVFEVAVGGALAGTVVPLLAGSFSRGDRGHARATLGALYGWMLLVLLPVALLVALLSGPLSSALLGTAGQGCDAGQVHDVAASLLLVFAVQIPVYGLTVVAQGALQADHRFLAPAWAPLLASLGMIAVLLGYAWSAGDSAGSVTALSTGELVLLGWGTTAAVALLLLTQLPASARARLLVRPRLTFPPGVASRARALGLAGLAAVAGQWLVYGLLFRLVNEHGVEGSAVVLLLAWTVFLLPWAVLVYPLATGSFPRLASAHERGDADAFSLAAAGLLRGTLLLGLLGAAGVAATAPSMSAFLVLGAPGRTSVSELAATLTAIAPAVAGFAVIGAGSRVLYAAHRGALTSAVTLAGWVVAALAAGALCLGAPAERVVVGAGAGVSLGLAVGAVAMVVVVARTLPPGTWPGLVRAGVAAVVAAVVAGAVGRTVTELLPDRTVVGGLLVTLVAGAVTLAVFAGVAVLLDREDVRQVMRRRRGVAGAV
jgi:putative peptidoglycan lipid II flippase